MKFLKFSVLFVAALVLFLPSTSQAQRYRMYIMDATGSMTLPYTHPEYEADHPDEALSGTTEPRFDAAKRTILRYLRGTGSEHNALYVIDADTSRLVVPFEAGNKTKMENAINALQPTGWASPMADVMCQAMDALEAAAALGGTKHLYLVTDGEENNSGKLGLGDNRCSQGIDTVPRNIHKFNLDALSLFPGEIIDNDDREFAPRDSIIDHDGLAYRHAVTTETLYWAGGVQPGSWEWNMFYKVQVSDADFPTDNTQNKQFDTASPVSEIKINITNYYTDSTMTSYAAPLSPDYESMTADELALAGLSAPAPAPAVSSTTSTVSRSQIDNSLFGGLSLMTGGVFTAAQSGQPVQVTTRIWDAYGYFTRGSIVKHNGKYWECNLTHQSYGDLNWAPGIAHSLWTKVEL